MLSIYKALETVKKISESQDFYFSKDSIYSYDLDVSRGR